MGKVNFDPQQPLVVVQGIIRSEDGKNFHLLPFILDTGASSTLIPSDVAVALGYDPAVSSERRRIVTGSSVEHVPVVKVHSFTAIGETVENLEVLCHDLPPEAHVDGLLGMNFLKHFDLALRFSERVIEIKRLSRDS